MDDMATGKDMNVGDIGRPRPTSTPAAKEGLKNGTKN